MFLLLQPWVICMYVCIYICILLFYTHKRASHKYHLYVYIFAFCGCFTLRKRLFFPSSPLALTLTHIHNRIGSLGPRLGYSLLFIDLNARTHTCTLGHDRRWLLHFSPSLLAHLPINRLTVHRCATLNRSTQTDWGGSEDSAKTRRGLKLVLWSVAASSASASVWGMGSFGHGFGLGLGKSDSFAVALPLHFCLFLCKWIPISIQ